MEDNKTSKASSLCQGSGTRNTKPSDEESETPEQDEEGEDTGELIMVIGPSGVQFGL